jgi:hypothetical protein
MTGPEKDDLLIQVIGRMQESDQKMLRICVITSITKNKPCGILHRTCFIMLNNKDFLKYTISLHYVGGFLQHLYCYCFFL